MKHQYFGDVNDYAKYGILRCIAAEELKIGVCWMLTPNDASTHGKKTQYLSQPKQWQHHDSELFSHLALTLDAPDGKHVRHVQSPAVIPNAQFFDTPVPSSPQERRMWLREISRASIGSDLVFFDPDNGIEVPSRPFGRKNSEKYVYWGELTEFWKSNCSLLIYQHFPRFKKQKFIPNMLANMQTNLPCCRVEALVTGSVLFLFAVQPDHWPAIERMLARLESQWAPRVVRWRP